MNKFLIFRIYAPMVSWGSVESGQENRGSDNYPTKTAILGLICGALGIRRSEEDKIIDLNNALGYSVKVIRTGELLTDYHTTQVDSKLKSGVALKRAAELNKKLGKIKTILSSRSHRVEALYYVTIWLKSAAKYNLEQIFDALKQPVFSLYFGRKSCPPAAALEPKVISAETLKDVFDKAEFSPICYNKDGGKAYTETSLFSNKVARVCWEDCDFSGYSADMQIERYDSLISRKRWQFKARTEFVALLP